MLYIDENQVNTLITWKDTFKATEAALKAVSTEKSVNAARSFAKIDKSKLMITMPGYLEDDHYGAWACKVLSINNNNANRPTFTPNENASIMLLDQETGALQAIIAGKTITSWRTAAASAVATKYLHVGKPQKILAIFGVGNIGTAHALCFYNCFNFEQIRLWNRTTQKATELAQELNEKFNTNIFCCFREKDECARGADVIVTATAPGKEPLVHFEWLKEGVHINAAGVVGSGDVELDKETYKHADVYVDSWAGANRELARLRDSYEATMKAEVGELIIGKSAVPGMKQLTVFQSLGMASEDCAMARMIFDLYIKTQK